MLIIECAFAFRPLGGSVFFSVATEWQELFQIFHLKRGNRKTENEHFRSFIMCLRIEKQNMIVICFSGACLALTRHIFFLRCGRKEEK